MSQVSESSRPAPKGAAREAALQAATRHYVELAERSLGGLPGAGVPFVEARRAEGLARFSAQGLPTTKHEAWKYTSLAGLAEHRFAPGSEAAEPSLLVPHFGGNRVALRAEAVDVHVDVHGLKIMRMAEAVKREPALVEAVLSRHAPIDGAPLTALNAALWRDGLLIVVEPGVVISEPLHLVYAAAGLSVWRNLIVLGRGAGLTVVEHLGKTAGPSLTSCVTEAMLGEGSSLTRVHLQEHGAEAYHVGSLHVTQERQSRLAAYELMLGGKLARSEVMTSLSGPGASCKLDGLYLPKDGQLLDVVSFVDHAAPHCTSEQLYKGVLDGQGRAAWTGRVLVRKDAQKTAAQQNNKNLLLADGAHVDARPQLEIYADDVKCSHGAAIGRADADALFYLRSRGIGRAEAERLLTYAFASEVVEALPLAELRQALGHKLEQGWVS